MDNQKVNPYLSFLVLILLFQFSCSKSELTKSCFIPYVDFVAYNVNPNTLEVTFSNVSASNGVIKTRRWDFGDGSSYDGQLTPVHTYPTLSSTTPTQTYKVRFTVSNDCGTSYWTKEIKVGSCLATVKFSYVFLNDTTIQFTNLTTSPTPATYSWQFGDGSSSTAPSNISKAYKLSGSYVVSLKATNTCGENFATQTVVIKKLPVLTTVDARLVTTNSAVSGGVITDDGGSTITSRGVCWSNSINPTISNSKTADGTGAGTFNSNITGLVPATTYYVRAYATNIAGTQYGSQVSFTTLAPLANLTTSQPTSLTSNGAVSGGTISTDNGFPVTARGVCWNTSSNPTIAHAHTNDGVRAGTFVSNISGLIASTIYYVRAYATNAGGTAYGNEYSFTTLSGLPVLTTVAPFGITSSSANSGGNITSDGGFGVITRGVCWSTVVNPTISNSKTVDGSGNGSFSSSIINLVGNTTYYLRAYATNVNGTSYGNSVVFNTPAYTIGGLGPAGGYIFYDQGSYTNGWRYLEAAPLDQSPGAQWGCPGTNVSGANPISLGSGKANTTAIITSCPSAGIAARLCQGITINGASDWFLPSYSELNLMYQNLRSRGLGNFSVALYWTSTQVNSSNANLQDFSAGGIYSSSKTSTARVRAVRSF